MHSRWITITEPFLNVRQPKVCTFFFWAVQTPPFDIVDPDSLPTGGDFDGESNATSKLHSPEAVLTTLLDQKANEIVRAPAPLIGGKIYIPSVRSLSVSFFIEKEPHSS